MQEGRCKLLNEMPLTSKRENAYVLDYFCPRKYLFVFFWLSVNFHMHMLELCFTVQECIKEEECLEMVEEVQRGSKESLTPFQRVSQSLAIKKHHLWASTGSLQGFYRMFRDFYRMFKNFYKMFKKWILEDGWVREDAWMDKEVG